VLFRSRFHDAFGDVFGKFWNDFPHFYEMKLFEDIQPFKSNFPAVDIWETDSDYHIDIAIAGFNKDEVQLELKENALLISAESNSECSNEGVKCLKKEIARRSFRRAVRFPEKVDTEKIECSYKDGVINCHIGKVVPEKPEDTSVKIKIN
jgi:HSP20 family protein